MGRWDGGALTIWALAWTFSRVKPRLTARSAVDGMPVWPSQCGSWAAASGCGVIRAVTLEDSLYLLHGLRSGGGGWAAASARRQVSRGRHGGERQRHGRGGGAGGAGGAG